MGFSPGDFIDMKLGELHFESRAHDRIVLWSPGELSMVLEMKLEEAKKASDQLSLLISYMEGV